MVDNIDILKVRNSKFYRETDEPNGRDMSRRDLIKLSGYTVADIACFGLLVYASVQAYRARQLKQPKSIDECIEKTTELVDVLSNAGEKDIIEQYVHYNTDTSFNILARIGDFAIKYGVTENDQEWMKINQWDSNFKWAPLYSPGGWVLNVWNFSTRDTAFGYHDYDLEIHKNFDRGYAIEVPENLRVLFKIGNHILKSKGEDLTDLAESLSKKAKSLTYADLELIDDGEGIRYQAKKENLEISNYKYEEDESIKVKMSDGKNILDVYGGYTDGKIDYTHFSLNGSNFGLVNGKVWDFPRKVYNKDSAMYIIKIVIETAEHLQKTMSAVDETEKAVPRVNTHPVRLFARYVNNFLRSA